MKATINYVTAHADGTVPFLLDTHWTGTEPQPVVVEMEDCRPTASQLSLDREGFALDRVICEKVNYDDPLSIEEHWLPAVTEMVRRVTGASFVTLFGGPLARFSNSDPRSLATPVSAPARAVHSDLWAEFNFDDIPASPRPEYAIRDIKMRYGDGRPARWKIFNIWQMISPPPQDNSLALCDIRSVTPDDIVIGRGRFVLPDEPRPPIPGPGDPGNASITFFRPSQAHRWCYFSNMLPNEAIVFQTLDPVAGRLKGRVPHAAFDITPRLVNTRPRNSIEIRAIVAYD